jgi:proteasome alpha subunit
VAVHALAVDDTGAAQLQTEQLEVAMLDRTRQRARKFARVSPPRIADLLSSTAPPAGPDADGEPVVATDEQGVDVLAPAAPPPGTTVEQAGPSEGGTDPPDPNSPASPG